MQNLFAVAAGGAIGALCRYGVSLACMRLFASHPLAVVGTLSVNVTGCFLIGAAFAWGIAHPMIHHAAVTVGFLGALTTFSSFGLETARLLENDRPGWALMNVVANLALGMAAVYGGMFVARWWGS